MDTVYCKIVFYWQEILFSIITVGYMSNHVNFTLSHLYFIHNTNCHIFFS